MPARQPQQPRGYARRLAVLEGAARVFDRVGFAQASLSDISRESGSTSGSMYFYFPSKDDLALAIIAEQNARTFDAIPPDAVDERPLEALIEGSRAIAAHILTDPVVRAGMRLSLEEGTLSAPTAGYYEEWIGSVSALFARAAEKRTLNSAFTPEELGRTLVPYFSGVHLVANVLNGRQDLYSVLDVMWRVIIAAAVVPEHQPLLLSVVDSVFRVPQPVARA